MTSLKAWLWIYRWFFTSLWVLQKNTVRMRKLEPWQHWSSRAMWWRHFISRLLKLLTVNPADEPHMPETGPGPITTCWHQCKNQIDMEKDMGIITSFMMVPSLSLYVCPCTKSWAEMHLFSPPSQSCKKPQGMALTRACQSWVLAGLMKQEGSSSWQWWTREW